MLRAAAQYKKNNGFISVAEDRKYLFWTPAAPANASPALTIAIADIENLQQSPATSPKVRLRLVVPPGPNRPEKATHDFTFTAASARDEQGQITTILSEAIAVLKSAAPRSVTASSTGTSTPQNCAKGQPAAMAIAHAVTASGSQRPGNEAGWYDDNKLLNDLALHRSLLVANPALGQRFTQSSRDRPESITLSQFSTQFWTPRLHLLRAHAIEIAQNRGEYNVLPEIKMKSKPSEVEGQPNIQTLELSKDQIKLLFRQHSVIRAAYNDNVGADKTGKMTSNTFWRHFFNSRLYWKLRGIKQPDALPDPVLDKYLDYREDGPATTNAAVPHFIDLEGNEQNHSQRKGNLPDVSMRPRSHDKVPMLRRLNGLSEKLLASVAAADGQAHAPIGMDEETYNQLRLRDLQEQDGDNRVKLNIRDQRLIQPLDQNEHMSTDAPLYAQQSLPKVLANMKQALSVTAMNETVGSGLALNELIGVDLEDEDMEDEAATNNTFGNSQALKAVSSALVQSIRTNKLADTTNDASTSGLTPSTFEELTMTQNTTIEFLHFFWSLFLSGDGARANELAGLVETLNNSLERINAVASKAEDEKKARASQLAEQVETARQGSAKRRRLEVELQQLGGGDKAVRVMLKPTMTSIAEATGQYRKAYEEQSAALAKA